MLHPAPVHPRLRRGRRAPGAAALAAATALSVAGGGAAIFVIAGPADAAGNLASAPVASAALVARADTERSSRSTGRAALATRTTTSAGLSAPVSLAPGGGVTAYTVTAVAKPKPKVVTPPAATAAADAPSNGAAATAPSAPSGGSTSTYSSAGAALGLTPAAAAVYSAIRSTFGITNIGGLRAGDSGDHGSGRAVDVMISSAGQGDAVASYAIANMGRFGITYVIWQQRIWLAGSGGWRAMEDRGSATANHFDHVHISVG